MSKKTNKKEITLSYNPSIEMPLQNIAKNMKLKDGSNIVKIMFQHWIIRLLYEYDQEVAQRIAREGVKPRTNIF